MSRKYSRNEISQLVKTVLVRRAVDLTALLFSCTEQSVYFKGSLKKDPRGDFTKPQILAIIRELESIPARVEFLFDLDNWTITKRSGSWEMFQRRKTGVIHQREDTPYVITEASVIEDLARQFGKD